jgi:putative glutamine amidotransferase
VVLSVSDRPVIGLTTYLEQAKTGVWDVQAAFLAKAYFEAVTRAGGIAVLLPPQPVSPEIARRVLQGLDGLIIAGGKDLNPARYGQAPHPATDEPRLDRDAWEEELIHQAINADVPFLGICRGAQLLNVALGGSLHQHLPDILGATTYQAGAGVFNRVPIKIEAGSRIDAMLGGQIEPLVVPVYHHQSIDRLAEGLVISAGSEGGVIQAVELPTVTFGIAVQWHPEQSPEDIRLFEGLVEAARHNRKALA